MHVEIYGNEGLLRSAHNKHTKAAVNDTAVHITIGRTSAVLEYIQVLDTRSRLSICKVYLA